MKRLSKQTLGAMPTALSGHGSTSMLTQTCPRKAAGMAPGATIVFFALWFAPALLHADEYLYQQEPFDTIKLDEANKNALLKVRPLDLPDRRVPVKPNPDEELEIRLFDRPRKVYSVAWGHIVEVKLFERMVLDDAERLVESKKFDEAYPIYEFLEHRYPTMADLPASYQAYLKANAGEAYKAQRYDEALALLWELYGRNPAYKGVDKGLVAVAGKLIDKRFAESDYAGARGLLVETTTKLKAAADPLAATWNEKLAAKATELLAAAQGDLKAGRLAEASRACRQALAAAPDVAGGRELAAMLRAENPVVEVGVTALAGRPAVEGVARPETGHNTLAEAGHNALAATGSDAWVARRTQRLVTRSIAEVTAVSSTGNTYRWPLGEFRRSGNQATLAVNPKLHWRSGDEALTGYDVARCLTSPPAGSPASAAGWRERVAGVGVESIFQVGVDFKQGLARPEPFFESAVFRGATAASGLGPYRVGGADAKDNRYSALDGYFAFGPKQPHEIVERLYPNAAAAVAALEHGDVQAVDRLGPGEAAALADEADVVVEPYGVTTLHLLVPNLRRSAMNEPLVRRALAHALDRNAIFSQQLTRGKPAADNEVIDRLFGKPAPDAGPTLTGTAFRYDPAAASLLVQFATSRGAAPAASAPGDNSARPPIIELTLALPPDDLARLACGAIQRQLQAARIGVRLRELAPGASFDPDADLTYVEWTPFEPAAELPAILGRDGPGGAADPLVEQLAREALFAPTIDRANDSLAALDDAISERLLAIPLWRLGEYLAYHRSLHGVGLRPVTLYQNVEQWQLGE